MKKSGLAKYAEDPSTDLLCVCWAFDSGPVSAWIPSADEDFADALAASKEIDGGIYVGSTVPAELRTWIERHGEVHAWNAPFERLVLNGPAGARYGFPTLDIEQMHCSMASARVRGLPGALEDAADVLNTPVKKRISGKNSMRYLCKPRKDGTRPAIAEERERFLHLVPYCADDVRAERCVDEIVPPMSAEEREIWIMDQYMNDRGVRIDLESVENMEMMIAAYKQELDLRCRTLTGIKPSRSGPLAAWVRAHGYPQLENMQADTIRKVMLRGDAPAEVAEVLRLYSLYNMKSIMKYPVMPKAACADGRVRHMFMFYGAATGRWSSTIIQLHNLARPFIKDPETAIEIARSWDLAWLREMYPGVEPMKIFATCVRGMLIASPGRELSFPDFAGVEARYNAWMGNETWKLAAYRDYDAGSGPNLYCVVYGQCFRVDPNSPEGIAGKPIGKVLDLSMGYEGGVGAFVKMAAGYNIDLSAMAESTYPTLPADVVEESMDAYRYAEEQGRLYDLPQKIWVTCEGLKRLWRRAHPGVVALWADLKDKAIKAVQNPGVVYKIPSGRVMFKVEDRWLVMRLPSGRKVYYYRPEVKSDSKGNVTLYYYGINTQTRQWGRTSTYGGKVCENETQAGCRDLLARAKLRLFHRATLIGSVHDEPILEARIGAVSDEEIEGLMCGGQTWDEGLPLAVEIHRGLRYRK